MKKKLGVFTTAKSLHDIFPSVLEAISNRENNLYVGRGNNPFKLRPRELLLNFLIAASLSGNSDIKTNITFAEDPQDGDGVIILVDEFGVGNILIFTEHVFVGTHEKNINAEIIKKIEDKIAKGSDYGKDRFLFVFLDKIGMPDDKMLSFYFKNKDFSFRGIVLVFLENIIGDIYKYCIVDITNNSIDMSTGEKVRCINRVVVDTKNKNWKSYRQLRLEISD